MASRAPAPRRRERQWAGLGRAVDGVSGEAGWGGVGCYGLTAGETDQRRAAERRSPRSPHPAAYGARKNAAPGFPIPTFPIPLPTYGLPLHELTSTSTSTFALLRAIFAPVAASHTPSESSFSLLRSTRTVLPDAIPGLSSSSLLLVLSSGVVAFPAPCPCTPFALVVLTHGWELFLRSERRAENGGPGLSGDRGRGRGRLVYMT